ncbi:MAG: hypothetical protein A3A94_01150 [Candidatus Portnoybacteria bacterium RIFCSPLOWO2_01_FULL_43_11]|nr:MAG: hypothetical protein A3A94_01150 [Candidatus Portnoybacteria bacterium RIFCSPLOWO2_01_FULL_43_11]
MNKPKIGIIGIGMVGSPLKKYFEERGFKRGFDIFYRDADSKKGFNDNIHEADIVFVCVPTPKKRDGSCDIKIVDSVVKKFHNQKKVIVVKSTIEPGTVARLQKKYNCPILFNPEFLTESRAWEDFIKPDRQIIGHTEKSLGNSSFVLGILPQAYFSSPGVLGTYDFIRLTSSEAEMGKYAGNIFGAMKVTYANILADFCRVLEKVLGKEGINQKVDYNNVRKVIAHDSRIGDGWLDVSYGDYRGFGGYCFPKDMAAFIAFGRKTEKKLKKNDPDKKLLKSALRFLESIWNYNKELLKSQGLTIEWVSSHDRELAEKLKNNKK